MEEALQLLEASPEASSGHGGGSEEGMQGSTRMWLYPASLHPMRW